MSTINYVVPGVVPALVQPSSMTCWATVSTMLVSWHETASYAIADVMQRAGSDYLTLYQGDQGLAGTAKPAFLASLSLSAEQPQDFSPDGWLALLQNHGALWVTTNEGPGQLFAVHARVVVGISGDETGDGTSLQIVDPADGSTSTETLTTFTKKFDDIARADSAPDLTFRPQVVHF
jgi:hypothetical protein